MEDFKVDFITGSGTFAKTLTFPINKFTLVGATTRVGMLSSPLRDRFGLTYHLDFYNLEELSAIIKRSSNILNVKIDDLATKQIAMRSRGTPRIANRLLRRVRDFHQVNSKTDKIDGDVASNLLSWRWVAGLQTFGKKYIATEENINKYTNNRYLGFKLPEIKNISLKIEDKILIIGIKNEIV